MLIEIYLLPTHTMLEWGSGYSTLWYSQFVQHYYSIEHHKEWYNDVQKELQARGTSQVEHVLSHVPDGHKGWPGGFAEGTLEQFQSYVHSSSSFGVGKFDRVLSDGRARAACLEYILPYLKPDSIVFVHDYRSRRYYHSVAAEYYNEVGSVNHTASIVLLQPKAAT